MNEIELQLRSLLTEEMRQLIRACEGVSGYLQCSDDGYPQVISEAAGRVSRAVALRREADAIEYQDLMIKKFRDALEAAKKLSFRPSK